MPRKPAMTPVDAREYGIVDLCRVSDGVVHEFPAGDAGHETEGSGCWCGPAVCRMCVACDAKEGCAADPGCCVYGGLGWVVVDAWELRYGGRFRVVHRRVPGPEWFQKGRD